MATLLLIRHGQASYGQADYDRLSPRGQDQARALGKLLATARVDALFVGPLRRQVDTAALAVEAAAGALPAPTTLPELAEYPAFDLIKHFMPRLVAEDPRFGAALDRELANTAFHRILGAWSRDEWQVDGVERVGAFAQRVRAGLDHIISSAARGARIAVVTSAGPIGVGVGLAMGSSELHMVRTSVVIRNASLTELKFRTEAFAWHPERISLVTFNSTHHLPTELLTEY